MIFTLQLAYLLPDYMCAFVISTRLDHRKRCLYYSLLRVSRIVRIVPASSPPSRPNAKTRSECSIAANWSIIPFVSGIRRSLLTFLQAANSNHLDGRPTWSNNPLRLWRARWATHSQRDSWSRVTSSHRFRTSTDQAMLLPAGLASTVRTRRRRVA